MNYLSPLRSELKLNILLSLLDGEKDLSKLKAVCNKRETTILHVLKEFEKLSITERTRGQYKLTSLGLLEAQICKQCLEATNVIDMFKDFWATHDSSAIPPPLIAQLGAIKESTLIKTRSSELGKVHETFLEVLRTSKKVKGISPIFHPDYVSATRRLLNQGNSVELILTDDVFRKTIDSAEAQLLQKYITEGKLTIFTKDKLKLALTVTERSFSLGLFRLDGEYDYTNDLISFSPAAVTWGEELFKGVLAGSKKYNPT